MLFVKLELVRDALPVFDGSGVARVQAFRKIIVHRDNPARSHHGGVANGLQVILTADDGTGRWKIADPDHAIAECARGAEKSRVGVDPRRTRRAGFCGAVFEHLYAGPDALVSADHARLA